MWKTLLWSPESKIRTVCPQFKTISLALKQHSSSPWTHHPLSNMVVATSWFGPAFLKHGHERCSEFMDRWMVQNTGTLRNKTCLSLQETWDCDRVFHQDNDQKHKVKSTMEWFTNKCVQVLEWPSEIPYLNPVVICGKTWTQLFTNKLHPTSLSSSCSSRRNGLKFHSREAQSWQRHTPIQ